MTESAYFQVLKDQDSVAESGDETMDVYFDEIHSEADWGNFRFEVTHGVPLDYLGNDAGWRMCSKKLRNLLAPLVVDPVLWLPVSVSYRGEVLDYEVLHFTSAPDVLDASAYDKTGSALKYVLSLRKVAGRDVFCCVENSVGGLFVSDRARTLLVSENCTGLEYSQLTVRP